MPKCQQNKTKITTIHYCGARVGGRGLVAGLHNAEDNTSAERRRVVR